MAPLTDAQRELLEDKFLLWSKAAREGPADLRDYQSRAADAMKAALAICSEALSQRDQIIQACATAAEAQDRIGYEWVRDSLWAQILKRAGDNVRALLATR